MTKMVDILINEIRRLEEKIDKNNKSLNSRYLCG